MVVSLHNKVTAKTNDNRKVKRETDDSNCGLVCQFTTDKKMLQDYYDARRYLYKFGGEKFKGTLGQGEMDIFDNPDHPATHIMVAYLDGQCIGGARVVEKLPHEKMLLPSESQSFQFSKLLPDLCLDAVPYGELSRLVILPQYAELVHEIYNTLRLKAIELGLQYMVGTATEARARIYRIIAKPYASQMKIRYDVDVPDEGKYEDVKMYLAVLNLMPEYEGIDWNAEVYHNNKKATISKKEQMEA